MAKESINEKVSNDFNMINSKSYRFTEKGVPGRGNYCSKGQIGIFEEEKDQYDWRRMGKRESNKRWDERGSKRLAQRALQSFNICC